MQGVYNRRNRYLDLRTLSPVQERTERKSDWELETLLEYNGYFLCGMGLWNIEDYIGMKKNDAGHWVPYSVMSLHIYGCCIDTKTKEEFNLSIQPWYEEGDNDWEWLREMYAGRKSGWESFLVERARIRFTRRDNGFLLDARWVEAECFDKKFIPTGSKIDYIVYNGELRRVKHERWAYMCSNDCWEYPAEVTMKDLM